MSEELSVAKREKERTYWCLLLALIIVAYTPAVVLSLHTQCLETVIKGVKTMVSQAL